jgi:hypothetical protein
VGALSRVVLGTAFLALAAVALVVVLAGRAPVRGVAPAAPLTVQATFDRTVVGFGDRVNTSVVVLLDRKRVDPARVQVTENLAPLQPLAPVQATRTTHGRLVTLTYDIPAACLDDACLSLHGPKRLLLAPVRVDAGAASSGATWPALSVRGRVVGTDLIPNTPPLRADVAPPPVRYRIAPGTIADLLEFAAVVLAAAGIALAGRQLWTLQQARRRREAGLSDIELALVLAREAETRPPADRRRALGLLARLLARRDDRLAGAARDLAWSEPAPTTDALSDLVTEVEREVNGSDGQ